MTSSLPRCWIACLATLSAAHSERQPGRIGYNEVLLIPSEDLFTRTSHYVLGAFRIGICECFGIQGLKMPARTGFSDFHGLGWGGGGGGAYFR